MQRTTMDIVVKQEDVELFKRMWNRMHPDKPMPMSQPRLYGLAEIYPFQASTIPYAELKEILDEYEAVARAIGI